jgi:hypothetical protein
MGCLVHGRLGASKIYHNSFYVRKVREKVDRFLRNENADPKDNNLFCRGLFLLVSWADLGF